jgi:hypothetical protein
MSTIFDRLGAILVTWYPLLAWHARDLPRASPPACWLAHRVRQALAGLALWQVSAEAAGYVGGEGHVFPLALAYASRID